MIGFRRAFSVLLLLSLVCAGAWVRAQEQNPELVNEARELLDSINQDRADLAELRDQEGGAEGEELQLLERRRQSKGLEALDKLDKLVKNVLSQEEQGLDAGEFRTACEQLVTMLAGVARQRIESLRDGISELGSQQESVTGEDLVKLQEQIAQEEETLRLILNAAVTNAEHMAALGLDATDEKVYLSERLANRAENASARIELSLEQITALQDRLKEKPDDADLKAELSATEAKRDRATTNLSSTIELMDRLEMDTTEFQKLYIRATGQITTDILDTRVAAGLFQQWLTGLKDWVVDNGPRLIFKTFVFLLILFVFHVLARLTRRVVRKAVSTSKLRFSQLLQNMFVSMSGNVVRILGLLVALSQLGLSLGPLLAGLGIAGFIVGFALQDTLGNFAAGMMILTYRPYDVGDMIEASGVFGKVNAMSLVSTTILTIDNQTLIVPNGKIWGDVIKNVTAQTMRRVDLVFGISYTDDIPHTEKVLAEILQEHPKVLDDPAPVIKLHNLGDSSVDFIVRPWVKTDDYWNVHWDITREVKMRFDRESISIPFPQRDVHFYEQKRIAASVSGSAQAPVAAPEPMSNE